MTGKSIYTAAIKKLGGALSEDQKADFEARAPYLLAAFCTESEELDAAYRDSKGLAAAEDVDTVFLSLDENFPRADRFSSAAAFYLAAMLVIDDNIELSDKLFDNYCDSMARIQSEIPTRLEKIAQKYD